MSGLHAFELPPPVLPDTASRLRQQVRAFLAEEQAAGTFEPRCDPWLGAFSPEFSRKLGARGWLGMTWPKDYGGHERSPLERFVVIEELLAHGAPVAAHWVADRQTGPSVLRYGTEQQRRRFLPAIAEGRCYFAIGMSEPDCGSDLASVRTRAERAGDRWIVNGTKVWTSGAHRCDYMTTLLRTSLAEGDRHGGLSQFLVDLHQPGVTVRPIELLSGEHHFNEVILDDVEVGDDMVLGEIGEGWNQVSAELAFERSGPERFLSVVPLLVEFARIVGRDPDAHASAVLGTLVAQLWAIRQMSLAVAVALGSGRAPEIEAALVKEVGTRFEREMVETLRRAIRFEPTLASRQRLVTLLAESVLHSPAFTLRGGTNEILRIVIARGLGL